MKISRNIFIAAALGFELVTSDNVQVQTATKGITSFKLLDIDVNNTKDHHLQDVKTNEVYSQKYNHNEEFIRFLEDDSVPPGPFLQFVIIPIVFIIAWIAVMLCIPGALCMSIGTTLLPFGGIGIICQGIGVILMAPMFSLFFLGIAGGGFDPIKDGEDEDSSSTFNVGSLLMSLSSLYNMTDVPGNVFFNIDKP